MVILNGRRSSNNDSFTFIGMNGSSVVDYCLVPIERWHILGPFPVLSLLEVSHRFHIPVDCNLPDHSILLWSIKLDSHPTFNQSQNSYSPNLKCKFKIRQNYMQSNLALNRIQDIIHNTNPFLYKNQAQKKYCHPW